MRVVAGVAGGRRLAVPRRPALRPTTDRVREALFSSLESLGAVRGATVLDLFAGTGALGIEALSRGAVSATFVECDRVAVATISANLAATGLQGGTVVRADVFRFLDEWAATGPAPPFDLALVDPPYTFSEWPRLLEGLPAGLAALEAPVPVEVGDGWRRLRSRTYGGTVVTLAQRPMDQPASQPGPQD